MSIKITKIPNTNYGSTPHIPGSRLGPSESTIEKGQLDIITGKKIRPKVDYITVSEKLDGSNVSVFRDLDGSLIPLQRKGYLAKDSPYLQHRLFYEWVFAHFYLFDDVEVGHRVCGEWLAQAHGTLYRLGDRLPFVAFDYRKDKCRIPVSRWPASIALRFPLIQYFEDEWKNLSYIPSQYGAVDEAEGIVWRVDSVIRSELRFNFCCKYVKPNKEDGKYLPEINPQVTETIWNWHPDEGKIWHNNSKAMQMLAML